VYRPRMVMPCVVATRMPNALIFEFSDLAVSPDWK
jgi:hypothetical protein